MIIEMTDLLASLEPDPICLLMNGRKFAVDALPVATVLTLGEKSKASNKELAEYLKQLFGEATPPSIDQLLENYAGGDDHTSLALRHRLTREVMLIHQTLLTAIAEVGSPKKLEAALEKMRQRVTGTEQPNSPTSDISAG